MKITINIPTRGRAGMIETFNILPSADYWVHESEIEKYKKAHKGINVKKLPEGVKGNIAIVRNYILKNQDENTDAVLQMDDDISHIDYWDNNKRIKLKS